MSEDSKTQSNRSVSTLFVRKIPTDAKSSDLEAFFSEVGPIRNCFVVADTSNGKVKETDPNFRNKGYGYVHYAVADDAQEALKTLKNVKFKGQTTLHLELALRKSVAQKRSRPDGEPAAAKKQKTEQQFNKHARVIVRNLPWKYTEKTLKKIFGKHGEVKEIQLPRKYPGGPLRGFAFIQFDKVSEAQAAMDALNATEHHGRLIAVDWSLAKDRFEELERQEAAAEQTKETEEQNGEAKEDEEAAADSDEEMTEAKEESNEEEEEGEEDDEEEAASKVEKDKEESDAEAISEDSNDESDEESSDEEEQDESEEEFAAASENEEMDVVEESETENEEDDEDKDDKEEEDDESSSDEQVDTESAKQQDQKEKKKKRLPSASEGTTLFVRNLLFESTEEDLKELFKQWGPVLYAKITRNPETNQSRGTAFVCMRKKEDADRCIKEADTLRRMQAEEDDEEDTSKAFMSNREKKKKGLNYDSILTPDAGLGLGVKFTLDGRVLDVTRAVERKDAAKMKDEKQALKKKEDKRNIYLMYEGVVFPNTPAAETMSPRELSKRQMSFSMRKRLLSQDPILFISKTRLSIRNLPTHVDDATLKKLGYQSIEKFKEQAKKGLRTDLSKEEKAEGWQYKPRVKQAKIIRSKDRVDASGKLRSKGYGFLEYTTHSHALAALRYLNNNPEVFGKKRLIVEFSIENRQVIENRAKRMQNKVQNGSQKNARKEAHPKKVPKANTKAVKKNKKKQKK